MIHSFSQIIQSINPNPMNESSDRHDGHRHFIFHFQSFQLTEIDDIRIGLDARVNMLSSSPSL